VELTALPQTPVAIFKGKEGGEGKERVRRGKVEGVNIACPTFRYSLRDATAAASTGPNWSCTGPVTGV